VLFGVAHVDLYFFYDIDVSILAIEIWTSRGRHPRSVPPPVLISRNNRDLRHFDEDDWTIFGWQDRRVLNDTGTHGKDSDRKDIGNTDTIIGFVYVGLLVIFTLVYLT
jgi:hypothetical protein